MKRQRETARRAATLRLPPRRLVVSAYALSVGGLASVGAAGRPLGVPLVLGGAYLAAPAAREAVTNVRARLAATDETSTGS